MTFVKLQPDFKRNNTCFKCNAPVGWIARPMLRTEVVGSNPDLPVAKQLVYLTHTCSKNLFFHFV